MKDLKYEEVDMKHYKHEGGEEDMKDYKHEDRVEGDIKDYSLSIEIGS